MTRAESVSERLRDVDLRAGSSRIKKKGYCVYRNTLFPAPGSARVGSASLHTRAYVSEYVDAGELGGVGFHKITVGRRRGGTTGTVVEGNK